MPQLLGLAQKDCAAAKSPEPELCKRLDRFAHAKATPRLPEADRILVARIRTVPDADHAEAPGAAPRYIVLVFSAKGAQLLWFVTWPENDGEKVQLEAAAAATAQGKPLPPGPFAALVEQQKQQHKAMPVLAGFGGRYVKIEGGPGCLIFRQDSDSFYALSLGVDPERGGILSLAWLPSRAIGR